MASSWTGEYVDGRSAALHAVELRCDGRHLLIHAAADRRELARWELSEVAADALHEGGAVHLQSRAEPDALLVVRDPDTAAALRRLGVAARGLPRRAGTRLGFAVTLALCIAAAAALVWLSATPLSKAIARRVPLEVERDLAGGVERRLAPSYCASPAASAALDGLAARLLGAGRARPPVRILNLGLANAFALPGGGVVLTRGLTGFADGPDEVAGVLAHEIAHVQERHVMAGLVRGTLLSALWAVSVGDFSGMMVVDPTTAFQIATLQFSREDEAEADAAALVMLARAGIDRGGLARFFERLAEMDGDVPEWLSSHPASAARAAAAAPGDPDAGLTPALSDAAWAAVRQACDDAPAPEASLTDLLF